MPAMRDAWAQTLIEIARDDDRVVLLDGDLASSTKGDLFEAALPDSFYQLGIAEQNMVGVAAGMATFGLQPWCSSFGAFLTYRGGDALRVAVAQTGLDVKFAGAYTGVCIGMAGKTHHDHSDVALLRTMPGMTVLSPGDAQECAALTRYAHGVDGPVYLRVARDEVPALPPSADGDLAMGFRTLRHGEDVTLVSTGTQTARTLAAAESLAAVGVQATVVHVPVLKPVREAELRAAIGARPVVTTEEHSTSGGLGSLVAELVTATTTTSPVLRIGVDLWIETGTNEHLLEMYGLSADAVSRRTLEWLATLK